MGGSRSSGSLSQDRVLATRLEGLLPTLQDGSDIDDVCDILRDRHQEYRRHKYNPFKELVRRGLEAVRRRHPELFAGEVSRRGAGTLPRSATQAPYFECAALHSQTAAFGRQGQGEPLSLIHI